MGPRYRTRYDTIPHPLRNETTCDLDRLESQALQDYASPSYHEQNTRQHFANGLAECGEEEQYR